MVLTLQGTKRAYFSLSCCVAIVVAVGDHMMGQCMRHTPLSDFPISPSRVGTQSSTVEIQLHWSSDPHWVLGLGCTICRGSSGVWSELLSGCLTNRNLTGAIRVDDISA